MRLLLKQRLARRGQHLLLFCEGCVHQQGALAAPAQILTSPTEVSAVKMVAGSSRDCNARNGAAVVLAKNHRPAQLLCRRLLRHHCLSGDLVLVLVCDSEMHRAGHGGMYVSAGTCTLAGSVVMMLIQLT